MQLSIRLSNVPLKKSIRWGDAPCEHAAWMDIGTGKPIKKNKQKNDIFNLSLFSHTIISVGTLFN